MPLSALLPDDDCLAKSAKLYPPVFPNNGFDPAVPNEKVGPADVPLVLALLVVGVANENGVALADVVAVLPFAAEEPNPGNEKPVAPLVAGFNGFPPKRDEIPPAAAPDAALPKTDCEALLPNPPNIDGLLSY